MRNKFILYVNVGVNIDNYGISKCKSIYQLFLNNQELFILLTFEQYRYLTAPVYKPIYITK